MKPVVKLDQVDRKILGLLIQDARVRLNEIAKQCEISSVSVSNRIKRLKKLGVITGATLFPTMDPIGFQIVALIGMETESNSDDLKKYFSRFTYLVEPSTSIGIYDLCALVYAENIANLDKEVSEVRKRLGVRKVIINVWSGRPHLVFENIDLNPEE